MCSISEWITPAVLAKFRPYRKLFILIAIVSILFAVLIVVENVVFVAINSKQHALLLLLPYILSWVLVLLGCVFARVAYLLHTRKMKRFVAVRPHSPSAWTMDSRPPSPSGSTASAPESSVLSLSYQSVMFRPSLTVPPTSPFFISDGQQRYYDEPPAYNDVVISRASPQPPASPNQLLRP